MSNPNPAVMSSIEQLNYRVTVGDVATTSGLNINIVQQELLKLAEDTQGHLQVAETGDIAYLFPKNFRTILKNKYWRLRWENWLNKAWEITFYLIKISFGIILIASILLMLVAIIVIVIAINSSKNGDNDSRGNQGNSGGGGIFFLPRFFWFSPNSFAMFSPDYERRRYQSQSYGKEKSELNFLESIYSFLFGDGNPNHNLEEKRWQEIATVIKNNQGVVIAEQLAPYLDNITPENQENEDYILPVLTRFNGYPEVSNQGEIIYYFPELQVTAESRNKVAVTPYLKENLWQFSLASSGQKITAFFLGGVNIVLALVLGSLLTPELAQEIGGLILFVNSIYGILIAYAISYLAIPLIRYLWLQRRNKKVNQRNFQREEKYKELQSNPQLAMKINYAQKFAKENIVSDKNLAYSTEKDLLDQDIENRDKINQQWNNLLDS